MIFDKDPGKNVGKFLRYGIKILLSVEISFAAIQLDCKCPVIANNVFLNQVAVEIFQDFTLVIFDSYASLKAKSLIAVECTRINYWDVETKNSKLRITYTYMYSYQLFQPSCQSRFPLVCCKMTIIVRVELKFKISLVCIKFCKYILKPSFQLLLSDN